MKRHIRIDLEYDGTGFCGWQDQAFGRTIERTLREAIQRLLGHPATVYGSGRTDAGVHAEGQVASFHTDRPIPVENVPAALNGVLPPDISVLAAREVPDDWSARHDAVERHYRYVLFTRKERSAVHCRRAVHFPQSLDLEAMSEGAALLVGKHDFESFRSAECSATHAIRTIHRLDLSRNGDFVTFAIIGNAFLRHQVRIMAGTLLEVGTGRRSAGEIGAILHARDRTRAGKTAPAHGLTLVRVLFPEDIRHADDEQGASGRNGMP